jgi:hypothetical protein
MTASAVLPYSVRPGRRAPPPPDNPCLALPRRPQPACTRPTDRACAARRGRTRPTRSPSPNNSHPHLWDLGSTLRRARYPLPLYTDAKPSERFRHKGAQLAMVRLVPRLSQTPLYFAIVNRGIYYTVSKIAIKRRRTGVIELEPAERSGGGRLSRSQPRLRP